MDWTQFKKGVFVVNLLGIIYNPQTKMILIGKRVNDTNLKSLSWVFPGGRPDYEKELEDNLQYEVKENTGLDVTVGSVVFSKTYPELREFLSVYYYCEPKSLDDKAEPSGNLEELKWIKPTEIIDYFTTSIHPKIMEYLESLEE